MPTKPKGDKNPPTNEGASNGPRTGHFLTLRDRQYILDGPEPKQTTRRTYRGNRIATERRAYKNAHARVLREAKRDARGALEDLAFLAQHMDANWLFDVLTEQRPLHPVTQDEMGSKEAAQVIHLMGRPYAPLEEILRHALAKLAWERWWVEEKLRDDDPETPTTPTTRRRKGVFVSVRLAAAMEHGINKGDTDHPDHVVQIVSRQDPAGMVSVWGYPERRKPRK